MRDGWRTVRLGDLMTLEYGRGLTALARDGGAFPVYGSAGVVGWHSSALTPEGPVIVIGRKGTAGAVHWSGSPCWPIDTTYYVRPSDDTADVQFVYLLLQAADLPKISAQTGVPGLNRDRVYEIPVLVPPRADQGRIVDLLDVVDRATDAADDFLARARPAYARTASTFFDVDDHHKMSLGRAVDVRIGRQRAPRFATGDINTTAYLRAANVKDGRLELDDVLSMSFDREDREIYRLRLGDVLVSEGCGSLAQLGASARWNGELPGDICFQNTLLRLRARPGVTDPSYVHHLARHAHAAGWWASIASGTNIFHIGASRAEDLAVPVPELAEQVSVARVLDSLDAAMRAATAEVVALKTVHGRLASALLSGAHVIPDSYDRFLDAAS